MMNEKEKNTETALGEIREHLTAGLRSGNGLRDGRRIGLELKFPLVNRRDGTAVGLEKIDALWAFLAADGWSPDRDRLTGNITGARRPGPRNDTVASCETGYCKTEFSLAHVGDLFELKEAFARLRLQLHRFAAGEDVAFLGYGIQPVTRPGRHLLYRKSRTSVWESFFPANRIIPPEEGDDMHLLTIPAASHVHLGVTEAEAVPAVNVLNGFTGAQLALTAHSNIWQGRRDPEYRCVAEKFWDWWLPDSGRVGMPARPFRDMDDYIRAIMAMKPIYVERDRDPLVITAYESFLDYYRRPLARAVAAEGKETTIRPRTGDIDIHNTCYWFNARLSRYNTVENRLNDQQPAADVLAVPALTLGLLENLAAAAAEIAGHRWADLRAGREDACRHALAGKAGPTGLDTLAGRMLDIARGGLEKRGRGEAAFLEPLEKRLAAGRCPADEAADIFARGGVAALVEARAI